MKKSITRGLRVAIAIIISETLKIVLKDPNWIWLAPIISALGKAIREKFPQSEKWIPF